MSAELLTHFFSSSCFYITCETIGRENIISGDPITHLLRTVLNQIKQTHRFQTLGYVLLPDHVHLVIKPNPNVTLDAIIQGLIRQFEREYATLMGQPEVNPIWERSYPARRLQDGADLGRHLDWVHYNPVYHRHVDKPDGWLHSSYQVWCERGLYQAGWGSALPESIKGKRWG